MFLQWHLTCNERCQNSYLERRSGLCFYEIDTSYFLNVSFVPYLQIGSCLFTHLCLYFKWLWRILFL